MRIRVGTFHSLIALLQHLLLHPRRPRCPTVCSGVDLWEHWTNMYRFLRRMELQGLQTLQDNSRCPCTNKKMVTIRMISFQHALICVKTVKRVPRFWMVKFFLLFGVDVESIFRNVFGRLFLTQRYVSKLLKKLSYGGLFRYKYSNVLADQDGNIVSNKINPRYFFVLMWHQ